MLCIHSHKGGEIILCYEELDTTKGCWEDVIPTRKEERLEFLMQ